VTYSSKACTYWVLFWNIL